jgi:DNA-directed RNA polymerase specialized sigma24 family protein
VDDGDRLKTARDAPLADIDAALAHRLRDGDENATAELARRFAPQLRDYLVYMLGDRVVAAELTREVLTEVASNAKELPAGWTLTTYLYRTATLCCRARSRR